MSTSAESAAARQRVDPTHTATIRSRLSGRLAGGYGPINGEIREAVVERDVFGTRTSLAEQLADYPTDEDAGGNYDAETAPALAALTLSEQVRRFREWLDRQQEQAIRGDLSRRSNPWLVQSYNQSIRRAETALREAGFGIDSVDPSQVQGRQSTLDAARSRFDDRVTALINDTTGEVSKELQEGLEAGIAATPLADLLVERVNHSRAGRNRAQNIANGEVVRVANGGALDRYEQAGAQQVGAQVEVRIEGPFEGVPEGVEPEDVEPEDEPRGTWSAVMDSRTCPQCATLNGQTFPISDIRAGVAPMPVRDTHDLCRCFYNKPLLQT